MSQELDLGSIVVSIQLAADQLEQTADSAIHKLNEVGKEGDAASKRIAPLPEVLDETGAKIIDTGNAIDTFGDKSASAAKKLSPLPTVIDNVGQTADSSAQSVTAFAKTVELTGNTKIDKLSQKIADLTARWENQNSTVSRLGTELDDMAASYAELEKAAGRSGDFDLSIAFPEQTAQLDKEIAKLDELKQQIRLTEQERKAAAAVAVQAAQKQAQAAEQAVLKQQELNQKLADRTGVNSAKLGMDAAAMSIRGVSSAAGGTVGSLGYLATEVMFLKRTMTAGASSFAAFASVLGVGVMAAVTLVSAGIKALKKKEEERQKAFEDGVRNLQQYSRELQTLKQNYAILQDQKSTTIQLTDARNNLASTFSELIVGYTNEGEAILASNEVLEKYIESQKEAARINRKPPVNMPAKLRS